MDKKTIFRLAIERARDNGWTHFVGEYDKHFSEFLKLLTDDSIDRFFTEQDHWAGVLYDNCFCRAFWGTEYLVPIGTVWEYPPAQNAFFRGCLRVHEAVYIAGRWEIASLRVALGLLTNNPSKDENTLVKNKEYAQDLRQAVLNSRTLPLDQAGDAWTIAPGWEIRSREVGVRVAAHRLDAEDFGLMSLPGGYINYDDALEIGRLTYEPLPDATRGRRILDAIKGFETITQKTPIPQVLHAAEAAVPRTSATDLLKKRFGFYELPFGIATPEYTEVVGSAQTLLTKLDEWKNRKLRGKTVFERLEARLAREEEREIQALDEL